MHTIVGLLRQRADADPSGAACRVREAPRKWRSITWADRMADVEAFAQTLIAVGIGHGDCVAIVGRTDHQWQLAEWGTLLAGGVVVGVDPTAPDDQVRHMMNVCQPRAVCALNAEAAEELDVVATSNCRIRLLLTDDDGPEDWIFWRSATPATQDHRHLPAVSPDDTATFVFTSGASGAPKAIAYTHGQLMTACRAIGRALPLTKRNEPVVCWLPMSHLFQRMVNLHAVDVGGVPWFVDDPKQLGPCLPEIKPKALCCVPRLLEKLLAGIVASCDQLPGPAQAAFERIIRGDRCKWLTPGAVVEHLLLRRLHKLTGGRLRYFITGSAPLPPHVGETLERLGWEVLEAYGLSENVVPMSANQPGDARLGSVGKPLPENDIRLAHDGEILVRGPGVFHGYVGDHDTPLDEEGFYSTGDLGRFDEDGYLYLVGRKSHMIKTSTGHKVHPLHVESVYQRHPLLDQVFVFGEGRPYLVALVLPCESEVRRQGLDGDTEAVEAAVRQALHAQGATLPAHSRIVDAAILDVPLSVERGELTPSLKVRRGAVAERYASTIGRLYGQTRRATVVG